MPRETAAQLRARIDELEAQNASLELQRDALSRSVSGGTASASAPPPGGTDPRFAPVSAAHVGRSIVAGILVVLGIILMPVALLMHFAAEQVTNTDAFVATYAPLASTPEVQEAITDAVVDAVEASIDLPALTAGLVDGLKQLDLPPFIVNSLDLAKEPLNEGVRSLIRWGVESVVTSDWFPAVWEQCLRLTHSQLNAILRGDPNAVATVSGDQISLQLGPVIETLKDQLVANGISFASLIPDGLAIAIPIATVEGIGQVKTFYAISVASGIWLPIIASALLVAGIAVAPRRRGWVLGGSIALGLIALVLSIALAIGRTVTTSTGVLTPTAIGLVYDAAVSALVASLAAVFAIAIVGIIAAWLVGPGRAPTWTRGKLDHLPAIARRRLALTNGFSRFLERYRVGIYWLVVGAVVVTIVFFKPLTIGVVIVAVVLGAVLLFLVEAFRSDSKQPPASAPVDEELADLPA